MADMINTDSSVKLELIKFGDLVNGVQITDSTGKFSIETVEDDIGSHDVIFIGSYVSQFAPIDNIYITVKVTVHAPVTKHLNEEHTREDSNNNVVTKSNSVIDEIVHKLSSRDY